MKLRFHNLPDPKLDPFTKARFLVRKLDLEILGKL